VKVLLTGSTCTAGMYLLKQLEQNPAVEELVCVSRKYEKYYGNLPPGQRVKLVECHLDKYQWTERLLSEFKPTHVVHIAGNGSQNASMRDTYTANVVTTMNLLDKVPIGCNFTLLSSVVCSIRPRNLYAMAKCEAERLVHFYCENNRIYGNVIRTCAIVGLGAKRGLLPDLVRKLYSDGNTLTLMGNYPGSKKPFVYAEELAQFIVRALLRQGYRFVTECFGPVNNLTVAEVASVTMKELDLYKGLSWDGTENPLDQKLVSMPAGTHLSKNTSEMAIKRALHDIMKGSI